MVDCIWSYDWRHLKLTGKRPCANAAIEWSTFKTQESLHLNLTWKVKCTKPTVQLEVNRLWHYSHSVLYDRGNGNSVEAGKAGTSQSQQQAVMTIKRNDLVSLDKKISSMLEKLKEWFYTILPLVVWHYLHLQELLFRSDKSVIHLYIAANDPQTGNDPQIARYRKWSRTVNDPSCRPQMIPPETRNGMEFVPRVLVSIFNIKRSKS